MKTKMMTTTTKPLLLHEKGDPVSSVPGRARSRKRPSSTLILTIYLTRERFHMTPLWMNRMKKPTKLMIYWLRTRGVAHRFGISYIFLTNVYMCTYYPPRAGQTYNSDKRTFLVQYWTVFGNFWFKMGVRVWPRDIVNFDHFGYLWD
ncbi:hypothetical protein DFH07DRAFT_285015 [Mycena maculata]|uniref:Uncharacterized protein n=1 Tax=Mycena maculata TaxID=230809 RepID=A0AAD7HKK0_9AGAR|nr:hypothetical protein DFH07DRAFT_285015 [Mycena maculata]